ncbi:hypothetical protein EJB05_09018, partial [Eragrostis curvula]
MSAHNSPPTAPTPSGVAESRGTHVFDITDYSKHRDLVAGSFLRSKSFHVGGFAWSIRFYPGGHAFELYSSLDHVAVTLELMTKDAMVMASYDMGLVDQVTGARYFPIESDTAEFDTSRAAGQSRWFLSRFMKKTELESSPYLRDDRLVIECSLAVIKGSRASDKPGPPAPARSLPPSDLAEHWGRLLKEKDGADVTFMVEGECFKAHRMVLTVRSPNLKAQLNWPDFMQQNIIIPVIGIPPRVFESLLHFIYTDTLPNMDDDLDEERRKDRIGHMLIAAKMYGLDRLKLICEDILSRSLEVETVSNVLLRAYEYDYSRLKDACIDFIISDRMSEVARTEGYKHLKIKHPSILLEVLEKAGKLHKI